MSVGTATVRMVAAVPPAGRPTVLFWKASVRLPSVDMADSCTLPVKPLTLKRVMLEVLEAPCGMVRDEGSTVRRKLPLFPLPASDGRRVVPAA